MKKVKVIIRKRGKIPGVGIGPVNKPVYITQEKYEQLKKLGYPCVIVTDHMDKAKDISKIVAKQQSSTTPVKEEQVEVENKDVVEAVDNEEVEEVVETTEETEESTEETSEDEVVDVLVDDPNYSAEAYYNEEFLTSKNICKTILDNRKVSYNDNASFVKLKEAVMSSNPVVEE